MVSSEFKELGNKSQSSEEPESHSIPEWFLLHFKNKGGTLRIPGLGIDIKADGTVVDIPNQDVPQT